MLDLTSDERRRVADDIRVARAALVGLTIALRNAARRAHEAGNIISRDEALRFAKMGDLTREMLTDIGERAGPCTV